MIVAPRPGWLRMSLLKNKRVCYTDKNAVGCELLLTYEQLWFQDGL
jgi:hypothetical protein